MITMLHADLESSDHEEFGSGTESTLYQNEPVRKSGRHHKKHQQNNKADHQHHKDKKVQNKSSSPAAAADSKPTSPTPLITFSPKRERQQQSQPLKVVHQHHRHAAPANGRLHHD